MNQQGIVGQCQDFSHYVGNTAFYFPRSSPSTCSANFSVVRNAATYPVHLVYPRKEISRQKNFLYLPEEYNFTN